MSLSELLPSLKELNHTEKLLAVQFLVNEMAKEENLYFRDDAEYSFWSQVDASEAAATLSQLLESEKQNEKR